MPFRDSSRRDPNQPREGGFKAIAGKKDKPKKEPKKAKGTNKAKGDKQKKDTELRNEWTDMKTDQPWS